MTRSRLPGVIRGDTMADMSNDTSLPIPSRLREVFLRWSADGRKPQIGMRWSRPTWMATFPDLHEFLLGLPDRVDREVGAVHGGVAADGDEQAVRAFVAAMVWGYGPVGYGAFRTARVLRENPQAPDILREAAHRVRRDGGAEAFAWFADHRLRFLGVAFASKYLFFCGDPKASPALILDRLVRRWLRLHADCIVRLDWHVDDYRRYLQLATNWAGQLGIAAYDVEHLIFADAASDEPGSQLVPEPPGPLNQVFNDEAVAVLDALEEAAAAFAAMSGDAGAADVDDFEGGVRRLKRIVLARSLNVGVPQP